MDLKLLLVRRITLVALACFFAGSGFAVYRTANLAKQQNEQLAESRLASSLICSTRVENGIELAVTDDGAGPPPESRHQPYAGSGLIGMRERVLALSGTILRRAPC